MLVMMVGLAVMLSCEREYNPVDENATTRGTNLNDTVDLDSGKVRIGDVVIDTTWNGETQVNF